MASTLVQFIANLESMVFFSVFIIISYKYIAHIPGKTNLAEMSQAEPWHSPKIVILPRTSESLTAYIYSTLADTRACHPS